MHLPNKILIIQTAFLGDVILTTPLVSELRKIFPSAAIDFLTIPNSVNILENNPDINEIIVFDKRGQDKGIRGLIQIGKKLKYAGYQICITPHRSLRSACLTYSSGADIRIGFNTSALKRAFTTSIDYRPDLHEIERNLSLLAYFDYEAHLSRPLIYPSQHDKNIVARCMKDNHLIKKNRIFALAPGSIWPTKRWPELYYTQICDMLMNDGYRPVLIGSAEDKNLCQRIAAGSPDIVILAGKLSLRQTTHFLTNCIGLLTNDSAPLHMGMAANIPVYAIFGATVPQFGFAPFGKEDKIIEIRELACRPCGIHGGKKCPVKTFDCMRQLTPDLVYKKMGVARQKTEVGS